MSVYKWILAVTLIIAVFKLIKQNIPFHLFLFIAYVSIIEFYAKPYCISVYQSNVAVSNLFASSCVLYYFLFYYKKTTGERNKSKVLIGLALWLIVWIFQLLSFDFKNSVDYITYDSGMIIITLLGLRYLKNSIETLPANGHDYSGYFFTLGILIFFTTCFPVITFSNYLILNEDVKIAYGNLLQVGNIFLYLGYMGSIICSIREA